MAGRWRNLISRLMSLLIAHPSPRRLFIGADRDRPWLVAAHRTVPSFTILFLALPHSFYSTSKTFERREEEKKKYRFSRGGGREGTKTVPSIGTFHP